jgi:hypothetical protein
MYVYISLSKSVSSHHGIKSSSPHLHMNVDLLKMYTIHQSKMNASPESPNHASILLCFYVSWPPFPYFRDENVKTLRQCYAVVSPNRQTMLLP